jgi:ATP-dependent DNA helicase HFM1/MER3
MHLITIVAPVKALCSERLHDWRSKFSSLGLRCKEYTGDTEENDITSLLTYHLILTTPEKWDSLTRKWQDNKGIVQMVKLFLIDEVGKYNVENTYTHTNGFGLLETLAPDVDMACQFWETDL